MALIETDITGLRRDRVQIAIDRLRAFCPPEGYYVAFSGGKDSQCVFHLCEMAGVPFDAHYHLTSVDPPELIRFIRDYYPTVEFEVPRDKNGNRITMWTLIPQKLIPPSRQRRYCCSVLKESNGKGRVVVTGVRWAESPKRAASHGVVSVKRTIFNEDNADTRRMVEQCYRTQKTLLNPIVDWSTDDVWEFINDVARVPHCVLYDQGFDRLGCIGCPLSGKAKEEFERWPTYEKAYRSAFQRMLIERVKAGKTRGWKNVNDVMDWFLNPRTREIDGQQELKIDNAPTGAESAENAPEVSRDEE